MFATGELMEAQLRVSAPDSVQELVDLHEWLSAERELTGRVHALAGRPGPTDLGGAFDALAVAVGSGGAGTALAASLSAWLRTRRAKVTLTVTTERGAVTVTGENISPDDVVPMLEKVLRGVD
jgi:hypothetical protein